MPETDILNTRDVVCQEIVSKTRVKYSENAGKVSCDRRVVLNNVLPRIFYCCVLKILSKEQVQTFISKTPKSTNDPKNSESSVYEEFWDYRSMFSFNQFASILVRFEEYLLELNRNFDEFCVQAMNDGVIFDRAVLICLISAFQELFAFQDSYCNGLKRLLEAIGQGVFGSRCVWIAERRVFFKHESQNIKESFLVEEYFVRYVWEHLQKVIIQESSISCSPVIKQIDVISVAGRYNNVSVRNGTFRIEGESYGHEVSVSEYIKDCKIQDLVLGDYSDRIVVVERDFHCPNRKRTVLQKGVAYGGPVSVYQLNSKSGPNGCNALHRLSYELLEPSNGWLDIVDKHSRLKKDAHGQMKLSYSEEQNVLCFNGKKISAGKQAKMLVVLLKAAIHEKRTRFYRREIADNPEYIISKHSTGVSVRFNRALRIINRLSPHISMKKEFDGVFLIDVAGHVTLEYV